ncbi:MAG: MBL fold metallo-hydrolase [Clostridiaceae bacterium]
MDKLQITWYGHSCFKLTYGDYSLVLDPYKDAKVPGLKPLSLEADEVFCSHDHEDHNYTRAVKLHLPKKNSPFVVTKIGSTHDDVGGKKRGMNLIHVFEADGLRIGHFGDLGDTLSKAQINRIGKLDVAMIPVGGFFTIDANGAEDLIRILQPKIIIPMHYRTEDWGFEQLAKVEEFIKLRKDVRILKTNTLEITEDIKEGTIILTYRG